MHKQFVDKLEVIVTAKIRGHVYAVLEEEGGSKYDEYLRLTVSPENFEQIMNRHDDLEHSDVAGGRQVKSIVTVGMLDAPDGYYHKSDGIKFQVCCVDPAERRYPCADCGVKFYSDETEYVKSVGYLCAACLAKRNEVPANAKQAV
jgi:hypothetical protein